MLCPHSAPAMVAVVVTVVGSLFYGYVLSLRTEQPSPNRRPAEEGRQAERKKEKEGKESFRKNLAEERRR